MADILDGDRDSQDRPRTDRPSVETLLVIKGAGNHRPGQTLDLFLAGFWPALLSIDPEATMRLHGAVVPGSDVPRTASATTEADEASFVEIEVPERPATEATPAVNAAIIRVREVYWEPGLAAPSATTAVLREWEMASFALGQSLLRVWRPQLVLDHAPKPLHWLYGLSTAMLMYLAVKIEPGSVPFLDPQHPLLRSWDALQGWRPLVMAMVAGGLVFTARYLERLPPAKGTTRLASYQQDTQACQLGEAKAASEVSQGQPVRMGHSYRGGRHCPGLPLWVLIALVTVLVVSPLNYLKTLAMLLLVQVSILIARWLAWPWRARPDSDTAEIFDERWPANDPIGTVNSVSAEEDDHFRPMPHLQRLMVAVLRLPLSAVLYRLLVVMTLPIVLAGSAVVAVLRWTRVLSGVGDALDGILRLTLAGTMGDIVGYAMEPGQALRIRQVLEEELARQGEDSAVRSIHIVAHSQGTPISYEVLFGKMAPKARGKLRTYLTIGSVLSFYAQSNDVLDLLPHPRFPVSGSPTLPPSFRWVNVWNLTDPIPEFSGLDEYAYNQGNRITQIRTPARLIPWLSHSSYWENLTLVMRPLACRILGADPSEWRTESVEGRRPAWGKALGHAAAVMMLSLSLLAVGPPALSRIGSGMFELLFMAHASRAIDACALATHLQGSLETVPVIGDTLKSRVHLVDWLGVCPPPPASGSPVPVPEASSHPNWFVDLQALLYLVTWVLGLVAVFSDLGRAVLLVARRPLTERWLTRT